MGDACLGSAVLCTLGLSVPSTPQSLWWPRVSGASGMWFPLTCVQGEGLRSGTVIRRSYYYVCLSAG